MTAAISSVMIDSFEASNRRLHDELADDGAAQPDAEERGGVVRPQRAEEGVLHRGGGGGEEDHERARRRRHRRLDPHLEHQRPLDDAAADAEHAGGEAGERAHERVQRRRPRRPLHVKRAPPRASTGGASGARAAGTIPPDASTTAPNCSARSPQYPPDPHVTRSTLVLASRPRSTEMSAHRPSTSTRSDASRRGQRTCSEARSAACASTSANVALASSSRPSGGVSATLPGA